MTPNTEGQDPGLIPDYKDGGVLPTIEISSQERDALMNAPLDPEYLKIYQSTPTPRPTSAPPEDLPMEDGHAVGGFFDTQPNGQPVVPMDDRPKGK